MSYILDALKRADAERGRGTVPGLHARQLPGPSSHPDASSAAPPWALLWGLLLVLAIGTGVWMWRSQSTAPMQTAMVPALPQEIPPPAPQTVAAPTPPAAQAAAPAATTAPVQMPTTPQPPQPLAPSAATAQNPGPAQPAPPARPAAPPPAANAGTASAPPAATQPPRPLHAAAGAAPSPTATVPVANKPAPHVDSAAHHAASAPTATAKPTPAEPSASPPAEPPLLSELPEDLRRQIPALTITGSVHASNPAQRLLVVNNQVLMQDGQLTPDLVLETIGSRHSVFRFRGMRFRIANQ